MINDKLWGGRFTSATTTQVEEFTASIPFDYQLAEEDILGSLAHVSMLGQCGILAGEEVTAVRQGLIDIFAHYQQQGLEFNLADEDIHMNIERLLTQKIGAVAGKLHTARSRNDQVALDVHLYLRKQTLASVAAILQLQQALMQQAEQHIDVIMPGYTHLQRAQPILLAHHLLAYVAMLSRDISRLQDSWQRLNQLPLGAGALAGTGFPIDRHYVANILGFDGLYENSLDAVSDRDFVVEYLAIAALIAMHLSRLSEELVLWTSQEFGFVELADAYCTGSSIMPQKKNPDVPELIRGKTGRVYGALTNLLTMLKGLPLAYNKDMQEDKEPLFDAVKTVQHSLQIMAPLISTMQIRADRMLQATQAGFINATDLADYLASKGMPFRQAHAMVGEIVQYALQQQQHLQQIPLTELQRFSPLIAEDIYVVLAMTTVVNARNSQGGTSKPQVAAQLQYWQKLSEQTNQWLAEKDALLTTVKARLLAK